MASSIKAVLDLDVNKFSAGIDVGARKFNAAFGGSGMKSEVGGAGEKLGEEFSRRFHRGFGAGELLKGAMTGLLGFASIDMLIGKVREHYERIAEAARKIAEENERGSKALEKIRDLFRTDPQRLSSLRSDFKAKLADLKVTNAPTIAGLDDPEDRGKAAKMSADLKENLLAQAELRKKIYDEAIARGKEVTKAEKAADDEREARDYAAMDLEDKLFHQRLAESNANRRAEIATDPLAKAQARLDAEKAITEQSRLRSEIDKQQAERDQRADEAEDRAEQKELEHLRRVDELKDRMAKEDKKVAEARQNLADASDDRFRLSLGDAAKGGGNSTDRARARQIQSLEKRASATFANGGDALRDEHGNLISAANRSRQLLSRADQLRQTDRFRSADRNPLEAAQKTLNESLQVQKQISESLKSASTSA